MLHFLRIWGHFLSTVSVLVTPFSWSLRVYSFCISLFSFKSIWEGDSCGFYHSYFSLKPLIYILRGLVLVLCRIEERTEFCEEAHWETETSASRVGAEQSWDAHADRVGSCRVRKEPTCFRASSVLESIFYGQGDGPLCLNSWRCKRDLSKIVMVLRAHFQNFGSYKQTKWK